MAHKLSSSLYDDGNKLSKGQEMYLKRAKKAQKWVHGAKGANGELPFNHRFSLQITPATTDEPDFDNNEDGEMPRHDKVPNLKLVMNPEGKLHDWTDLPREELPEMQVRYANM